MITLASLAFAAAPPPPTVAPWTARTLRWGEILLGTDGVALGIAPRVTVGTSPLLDLAGLPTGRVRVAPLETKPVAIALEGAYSGSAIEALDVTVFEAGPALSLRGGPVDLHVAADYLVVDARGATGWDRLGALALRAERLIAHGALELAATERGAIVATGGIAPWGRAAGDLPSFPLIDVLTAGPLDVTGAERTWWGTVGWRHTAGPLTVRAAVGMSAEPWVWLRDALSVQVRLGPPTRARTAGDVAEEEVEETDAAAASEAEPSTSDPADR